MSSKLLTEANFDVIVKFSNLTPRLRELTQMKLIIRSLDLNTIYFVLFPLSLGTELEL